MAVAFHTHTFEIPTASKTETAEATISNKALVPSSVGTAAAKDVEFFADAAQGEKADLALPAKELPITATRNGMEALEFPAGVNSLETRGYAAMGDGGGAQYVRVASEPTHNFKVRSLDRLLPDGTVDVLNGGWWASPYQDISLSIGAKPNSVGRANGDGTYSWGDVLYKRSQGGSFNVGATLSIMGHTGPFNAMAGGYWPQRNLDPPRPGIIGFSTDSQIASVGEVASVGLYNDIYTPPVISTVAATFTATTANLATPLAAGVLKELQEGLYLRSATSGHWGKLVSWTANQLVVSGWYANGNASAGQVPDPQNLLIGVVSKVWARNTNVLIDDNSYGRFGLGEELGCGNYGTSYDLFAATGNQANGLNIVSIGPGDTHWALLVSRQAGDGSFARGAYVSSCSYASYTAGRWGPSDTLTPTYGFLSNYAAGHMAFAVGGSTPRAPNSEKFYVEGTKGDIHTGGMVAIGTPAVTNSNTNRLIIKTRDAGGTSNAVLVRNSADTSVCSINDQGVGFFAGGLQIATNTLKIINGAGSPEGTVTAAIGSIYMNTNGGSGTTLYAKRSGVGNTGWSAFA
ncbi:hypothetical protein [Agrobacterium pusense]|uniref:hypothetical protein n=1 Tax=Agrobacterium pusense TaxID=648995 RepID=UPI000D1A3402|nr:hypothetical protein [Agrobacterium pusense]